MTTRTVVILLLFMILTWGGVAGITYGVVELTAGGPQGERGEQGARGERGPRGETADSPFIRTDVFGNPLEGPCVDAIEAYEEGLSTPGLSQQQVIALYDVYVVRCEGD